MEITHLTRNVAGGSVVQVLTELLGRAQRGEVTDLALACIYADGDTGFVVPSTEQHAKLIGATYQLLHQMCAS